MSKARQNLRKRIRQAALSYGRYDARRGSWGPEWERLCRRAGLQPLREATDRELAVKVQASALYGRTGRPLAGEERERAERWSKDMSALASSAREGGSEDG